MPKERERVMDGKTYKVQTGCGSAYITVNTDKDGKPFEVFMVRGKGGGCSAAFSEGICRLVSLCLRSGIGLDEIIKQTSKIRCSNPILTPDGTITSCVDIISNVLKLFKNVGVIDDGKSRDKE